MPIRYDHQGSPYELRKGAVKAVSDFAALRDAAPEQIDAYVDSHVSTLEEATELLKLIIKTIAHEIPQ